MKYVIMSIAALLLSVISVSYVDNTAATAFNVSMGVPAAYAKFRSRSSFSSRSRSRSVSVRSYAPKPKPKVRSTPKRVAKAYTPPKKTAKRVVKGKTSKPHSAFAKAAKRKATKKKVKKHQTPFAKKAAAKKADKAYSSLQPRTVTRISNIDRRTYRERRSNYYTADRLNSPQYGRYSSYAMYGSPSYGPYDSLFFWHVVTSNPSWAYHNSGNPHYLAWKREARQLSRENAELESNLNKMQAQIDGMSVDVDPNYSIDGISDDLMYAPAMVDRNTPTIKMCAGLLSGKYSQSVVAYLKLMTNVTIVPVLSNGSNDNLAKLASGECDAALVQRDSLISYNAKSKVALTRIGKLYNETVHLSCRADDGITDMSDMEGKSLSVYVGKKGSGAETTWNNFKELNPELSSNKTVNSYITGATSGCAIYVGYINSDLAKHAVSRTPSMVMVDITDVPVTSILDQADMPVYSNTTIAEDTYTAQKGWYGMGIFTETKTIGVPVDIVVNDNWGDGVLRDSVATEFLSLREAVTSTL